MALRDIIDHVTGLFGDPAPDITQKDVLDEDIRKSFPQYAAIPDDALARAAAQKDSAKYGYLAKYTPDSLVEAGNVPKTMRSDRFYQRYPDVAKTEAMASLGDLRKSYPQYAAVPDDQLAAAAEKNDPGQFKGLTAKLRAPDIERARKDAYQKAFQVSEDVLSQLKTALGHTSGAIEVQKFRDGFNAVVAPKIEQVKAAIVKGFAPSDENIVELTQKTGVIPYPDISYRVAVESAVSMVPSRIEDFAMLAVAPEGIKVLNKFPVLGRTIESLIGPGTRFNPVKPEVMPDGFKPPTKEKAPTFTFAEPQTVLPAGEEVPALKGQEPRNALAGFRTPRPELPAGAVEGEGFRMAPSPDAAAFMEHLGYSPKTGYSVSRSGYRPQGQSQALTQFESNLSAEDRSMLGDLRRGVATQIKTSDIFKDKTTGQYTPAREAVHKQIENLPAYNNPAAKAPEGDQSIARIVIGPPAAGKSSGMKSLFGKDALDKSVIVDNDEIKSMLPGWDPKKAELFHHESSDVEEKIIQHALEQGYNITQPILGKNPNKTKMLMQLYKENGYKVELYHVDLPAEKAAARTISRVREGGRFVDPRYVIDQVGLKPKQTYDKLKTEADIYGQVSNDVQRGDPPQFIERGTGDSSKLVRPGRSADGRLDSRSPESPQVKANIPASEVTAQKDLFAGAPEDLILRGEAGGDASPVAGTGDQSRIPGTNASFESAKPSYKQAEGAQLVPLSDISTDPARFQPRRGLSEPRVKDLADMMTREGYKASKPIILWRDPKDGNLYTLAGHHRLAAAWRSGVDPIQSVIFKGTENEAIALARRSNSTRAPMSAMEEARAFKAEQDRGADLPGISKNYGGVKTSDIQRKLELNNLPKSLQELVDQDQFPVNHAIELGRAAREYGLSGSVQQQIFDEVVKKMDVTSGQFRTMMNTLGPDAAKQMDMGLGFQLDRGILTPLRELGARMAEQTKAKRQLFGYVKYIDSAVKKGEKVTVAQTSARNQAARQVKRLDTEIESLQRSVGKAARAKMPPLEKVDTSPFPRRGETGSVTLGPDKTPPSEAGPATNAVQDRIGRFSDSTPLKQRAEDAVHQIYQDTIDRFHSISRYTKMATEGYTKPLQPGENPVLLARSYLGVSGKADVFLRLKTFRNTPSGNVKFTGPGLDEIMRPMRDALPDLDNYLAARRTLDLAEREIKTGISPETAAASVAELEKKYPKIKEVAQDIQVWNDSLLQYLVDSGRIGEQNYEAIKAANQFYAPMQRVMDESGNPEFATKSRNVFDRIINPIKKIKGSERKIISPIESMVRNAFTIMDAADRNAVARSIVKLREISPEVADLITPTDKVSRGTITVYENGKPVYYEVPKDLLTTMQGLNEEAMGLLAKILSFPARMLRAGATLTPEFAARNPIRDQWNAMINTKFGFIPGWDFQKGLFSLLKADESYARWQASGGAQSFLVSMNKAIEDVRYHPPAGYGAKVGEYAKNPIKILEDLSELSEKPTRLGIFKKASAKGASDIEAGFESREGTTDFGRRGARTKSINAIYAFFNARLQGVEKTARAFKERPLRSSLGAAPLMIASIYNYLAYKDDKEFHELPRYRRMLFWNFKVGHHWVSIPKGDVGVLFGGTAEQILEFVDKHDTKKLTKFAADLLDQISPIDFQGGGYIPTGIKPVVENIANYNFFLQRPVVPQGKQGLLPEHQSTNYDTEVVKAVGRALNVSPAKVTNLISGLTGGAGRYVLQGADMVGTAAGVFKKRPEQPKQPADYPLIRGFVARDPKGFGSNSVQVFYTNLDQIVQARDSLKKVPEERRKIFYDHPEIVAYKGFVSAAKALSVLRKSRDKIMQSDWPVERKKAYGDRIDEQVTNLARTMNRHFDELKNRQK